MEYRKYLILFIVGIMGATLHAQVEQNDAHKAHIKSEKAPGKSLSPHTMAMAMVNDAHIHIDYSAPSVRDRIIFGGLVGHDRVWQAGAHNATWISTDKDLLIAGQKLPAGKYGFFLIPGKKDWTVIFNSRWDQHGKDEYNEAEDVLRLTVIPEDLNEVQELLTYEVNKTGKNSGEIVFSWEKKRLIIPLEVK